jgi:hypothetical protein
LYSIIAELKDYEVMPDTDGSMKKRGRPAGSKNNSVAFRTKVKGRGRPKKRRRQLNRKIEVKRVEVINKEVEKQPEAPSTHDPISWKIKTELKGIPEHKRFITDIFLLRLNEPAYTSIRNLQRLYTMSADNCILQLIDFYNLRDFPLLIERILALYNEGLSPSDKGYLSCLYTLLQEIDRNVDLSS